MKISGRDLSKSLKRKQDLKIKLKEMVKSEAWVVRACGSYTNFLPGNKVYGEKLRLPVEAPPHWANGRSHWAQTLPSFSCIGSAVLRPGQPAPVLGSVVPRVPSLPSSCFVSFTHLHSLSEGLTKLKGVHSQRPPPLL